MAQNYRRGDFCSYVTQFKVEKQSKYNYTSIIKPCGAFYIPMQKEEEFLAKYATAVDHNEDVYMTEKHREISPFLIDLDLRFEKTDSLVRVYSHEDIENIINIYVNVITEYVELPNQVDIYVLEKSYPIISKGLVKDGVHIMIPNIVTKPSVQYLVRESVLPLLKPIFQKLGCLNPIEDIVDEAVIERNNWQMYGSKKPNCEPYVVTRRYGYYKDQNQLNLEQTENFENASLINILSIRNKYDASSIKIEKQSIVKAYEQQLIEIKRKKNNKDNPMLQSSLNHKKNTIDNLEFVSKIVNILSEERANSYNEWIRVGWCLRNIDYRLLDKWIEFSKKSPKFQDGECERLWNYMKEEGLGVGTLFMWAQHDNPEEYKRIRQEDIHNLIYASRNETHHDIAKVVHFMFKHEFVCASIKHNFWYQFREHRWVPCDSGYTLNNKLSTDVFRQYSASAAYWHGRAAATESDTEQSVFTEVAKKLGGIAIKLKMVSYKENVMAECKRLFYVEKFEEKIDSKCHLIGFENGVYDLELQEFRDGRPDDYISFTTGCNYIEYDESHPIIKEINTFIDQILPNKTIKEYVLLLLSSFLNGNIREERFHIWTGNGSNGKSKLIDLFEQSFGDYCCKFPVTLLTQKRAASNAASTELARAKGKRFAVLQEPSEDEKMNVGLMKELSGGDKIQARAIFKEPIEFKPQFKMVLTCNHLPNVPSDDGGTWRRIRLVEFTSKFTYNPDPEKENEFLIDPDLSSKFIGWREHFMALLIEYYKKYRVSGIQEPEEVLKCTKEYQRNNDYYLDYKENELENNEMSFLTVNDAYTVFKNWQKDNVPSLKIKKKDFMTAMDKLCGKRITVNRVEGWKGFQVKTYSGGEVENDNDDLD